MTLSSLFQKPALNALITGGVTDSVITASPAILLGYIAGGVNDTTDSFQYNYEIKNGSTLVMRSSAFSAYPSSTVSSMTPNGIDFPNGITVSTLANIGGAGGLSRARMTIFYILK